MSSRSGNSGGIVIQERDRRLLKELAVMRVADREQAKIAGGFNSTTRVNARLLALTRAGLLRRFFLGASGGSQKAIYSLSPKGAAQIGANPRGPRHANNSSIVPDFFVLHQLAVNDVYRALRNAVRISGIELTRWLSFIEPLTLNLRLIPDGYFEITTATETIAAFVEVDLGSEPLKVWRSKIQHYLHLAVTGEYESLFRQGTFRVLVVAHSERRLLSIRKTVLTATQKVFWFTTAAPIQLQGILGPIWLRPVGDERHPLTKLIPS